MRLPFSPFATVAPTRLATGKSVTTPLGDIRPRTVLLPTLSVNQRLPSAPAAREVSPDAWEPDEEMGKSVTAPAVVTRPM